MEQNHNARTQRESFDHGSTIQTDIQTYTVQPLKTNGVTLSSSATRRASRTRTRPAPTSPYDRRPLSTSPRTSKATEVRPSTTNTASANTLPDDTIGHVLLAPKRFRCAHKRCKALNFTRLADLRRHHYACHGPPNQPEYYCPVESCDRSRKWGGGGGRSFGTRKDKCKEHIRVVHGKELANRWEGEENGGKLGEGDAEEDE